MLVVFGAAAAVQLSLAFVLAVELVPKSAQVWVGSSTHALDGFNTALCTIYLVTISRNWEGFQYFGLFLALLCLIMCLWVPESPRFLYSIGKFDEARTVMKRIAAFNK